ncbi:hypothetical protein Clacol_002513 [Clathrus columnatus]|uniref:Ribonuclease P protein subunit n=1 Tax=Clathrus columnatus TaxID=1419009 RepID=A0AAV5A3W1_9AGAM|nr:hypothetical protein Clacol_002513 [Clathrus columnatus]
MALASTSSVDPYQELPQVSKSKREHIKFTTSAPFTPTFVQSIISDASSDVNAIYANRVKNRQLSLHNPAKKSRAKELADQRKARQALDKARRKSRVMSRKEAAATGVWKLRPEERSYDLFLPLNNLWKGYIAELLGLAPRPPQPMQEPVVPNVQNMQAKLVKADFHGSILSVRNANNSSLIGVGGIVIQETENTFKVITPQNKLKVIPKLNSTFVFRIPLYASPKGSAIEDNSESDPVLEFELSSDRATRKFKHKLIQ